MQHCAILSDLCHLLLRRCTHKFARMATTSPTSVKTPISWCQSCSHNTILSRDDVVKRDIIHSHDPDCSGPTWHSTPTANISTVALSMSAQPSFKFRT